MQMIPEPRQIKYINILLSRMKTDIKLNINMSHIYHTRQVTNNMTLAFHPYFVIIIFLLSAS